MSIPDPSIQSLHQLVKSEIESANQIIFEHASSSLPLIQAISDYLRKQPQNK